MKRNEIIVIEDDEEQPTKRQKKNEYDVDKSCLLNDVNINGTIVELSVKYLIKNRPHQMIPTDLNEYLVSFHTNEDINHGYTLQKIFEYSSIDWNRKGFVFFPWNIKKIPHWALIAIDLVNNQLLFFDSLGMMENYLEVSVYIKNWLNLSILDVPKRINTLNMIHCTIGMQHQKEGNSCGAYILFYLELLSRGVPYQEIIKHNACNDDFILFYRRELYFRLEYIASQQDNQNGNNINAQ